MASLTNQVYLAEETITAMRDEFLKNGFIQLSDFLTQSFFSQCLASVQKSSFTKKYVPDRFSFSEAKIPAEISKLLTSKQFADFVSSIVGKKLSLKNLKILSFSHKDYTLLHDNLKGYSGFDLVFDFNTIDESCGGFTSYVRNGQEVVRIVPIANALTLIKRRKDMLSFVKYVNHRSEKSRIFIHSNWC